MRKDDRVNQPQAVGSVEPASEVRMRYDLWHEEVARRESTDHSNSPWHRLVKPHLGDLAGLRVLEIGCGRGGFSKYLLEQGATLMAADYSESAVEITNRLLQGSPRFESCVADIQNIPFERGCFDLVISLETLEHIPRPYKGLSELVRVTKGGGRIIITTPNYFGLLGLARRYRELTGRPWTEAGQPLNQPLKVKNRVRALQRLHCRVDVVEGVGHTLPFPGREGIPLPWLDRPRSPLKWFAAHSLTVATKSYR